MSDYFLCCFYYNRQSDSRHGTGGKFPLRNIDKSMIGLPTNFQHCAHIGCSDLMPTNTSSNQVDLSVSGLIQPNILRHSNDNNYNRSQYAQPILAHMKLIDLKSS